MINGDTTQSVYKRKAISKTSAMTTPLKVNLHNPMDKTFITSNTYVRDEKEFLLSKQFRKAKVKGRFSITQHMNKDVIFNDYDAQNKNYTNLVFLSQQKRSLRKETNSTPDINNTSYITNNDIQTVVHKKGKLSSFIINPKRKQHSIIKPSKSTETLKERKVRTKHKSNSQYTIHIPGGVFNSRSRSKKNFMTPYRPSVLTNHTAKPCEGFISSPVSYTAFSVSNANLTPLKNSSEKVIEVMKGSNSGGKVDFNRRFEFYDYIKKYKMKKVIFIQKFYKERYVNRYKKVVLIQSFIRMFLSRQRTENYIKQFYFFLAGLNHLETVAKRKAKLREVFYKIKINAMLNAEYAAYIAKYNKKEQLQSIYKKMSHEVEATNEKIKNQMRTFSNVKIEREVSAFDLNGTEGKNDIDIFERISLKHKRPIKRKIVDDIDEAAREEILISNDVEISKLRNKRRQPTETISSQMNTEDNLQSDVDRRFKSRKVSKGALTIDSSVNISLINKLRNFDANCFEIDNKEELTIERKKKERQQYEIESIDIIIEESQNKKKILKSRRKPQSINRYKITSENISLYSNVPTESSINKIKEKLNQEKKKNISIAKKNIEIYIKNSKKYINESSQTQKSSNEILSLSSFLIASSPQEKKFDILKPQYHKNTLYIKSTPKTPTFNQKKFKTKSNVVLSFLGSNQKSFSSIKPSKVHKISLSYHNKTFSSLSPSQNESFNLYPNVNYAISKFTQYNSPIFISEITIEQNKRKLTDGSPITYTNNNLSISSGLNAMELITDSNKDSNSDDGNKDEALPIPSNRSLLNRAYNKYFSDLIGNNETEGNKSVRTNNNVSIVSIDNYIMYNMNIVSSSFELIANMSNEKLSKAILPVRLVDLIRKTVGKDVIDCIAERPTLKGKRVLKSKRNYDENKRKGLLKATKRQCEKPMKKGFDAWKREVMRRELIEKIKEGKKKELSEKKMFALSYYDNREEVSKGFSIKCPVKLSYWEDNRKNGNEYEFKHLGGISFYEDKRDNKELSFKKIGRLSYKENKFIFDEDKLCFKRPVSLSYKENMNTFDERNLSFKQLASVSYKENKTCFDEEQLSFKQPVSVSYKETNNNFNEDTLSFKQPVSLSYYEMNNTWKKNPISQSNNNNNQIATKVIKCSYNDKYNNNIIDKDFSYIYPSKLSYYESTNIPISNESHPVRLSYNSKSFSDFSLKHVSSLSYNELKLIDSNQFSLSFQDEPSNIPPIEEPSTKKKVLKSRRRPNKPKHPEDLPKEEEKNSNAEDDKALLTVRQKQIVKIKSRRKSYPIQQIFIRRIFFKRWKALALYSPRTMIIRQQRSKRTIQRFPSFSYHDILSYLNLRHCFNKWKKFKSRSFISFHNIHVIVANVESQNLHCIETFFNRWKEKSSSNRKLSYSPRTESDASPSKGIRVKLVQKDKTPLSRTINVKYSSDKKKPKSLNISNKSDKKYKEMKIIKKYVPVNTQNMDKIILFDSSVGETSALKEQLRKLREIVLKMVKRSSFMKWKGKSDKREIKLRLVDEFSSNNRRMVKYFILSMIKNHMKDGREFKELSDEKYKKGVAMMIWYTMRKKE